MPMGSRKYFQLLKTNCTNISDEDHAAHARCANKETGLNPMAYGALNDVSEQTLFKMYKVCPDSLGFSTKTVMQVLLSGTDTHLQIAPGTSALMLCAIRGKFQLLNSIVNYLFPDQSQNELTQEQKAAQGRFIQLLK